MSTYAQYADLVLYVQDADVTLPDQATSTRLLGRCEIDVDSLLVGYGVPNDDTGLKYDPTTDLQPWQAAALSRAVCAQAEYMLTQGESFFVEGQYDSWQGPDFAAKGKLPYFGPKVSLELARTGLSRVPGVTSISTSYLGSQSSRLGLPGNLRAS